MENVLGIVAEYNPFHNGHVYHLNNSKQITNSDYTIAIISGNFTQRGNTSLVNKWVKAKMAIYNGIDLVIELPTLYSTSSAENFAYGAIQIFNSLKIVNNLSFGAETDNLPILNKFASILIDEPIDYKKILTSELDRGLSFPKARQNALTLYLNLSKEESDILASPNNILAIEYLKSLQLLKCTISPIIIKRVKNDYNDKTLNSNIASATAIRNAIQNNNFTAVNNVLPKISYDILKESLEYGHLISDINIFSSIILYNIRQMSISDLLNTPDVSEGLEFVLKKEANSCNTIDELINNVCSKRYTRTRIQRILLYILLKITKNDIEISKNTLPYIRVLGFNNKGKNLISKISKANPGINIITSLKKFEDNNNNKSLKRILEIDIFATNTYTLGYKKNSFGNLDYTQKIITI